MYSCFVFYDNGKASRLSGLVWLDVEHIIKCKKENVNVVQHSPDGNITVIDMSKVYSIEFSLGS